MDAVDELEHACADAWPALVDTPLGQWRLRAAAGFTGRANSALLAGDPGVPVPSALAGAAEFARAHDLPARAMAPVGSRFDGELAAAGWRPDRDHSGPDGVLVLTGPLAGFPAAAAPATGATVTAVTAQPPVGWWPLAVDAATPTPAQLHVLGAGTAGDTGYATVRHDGEVTGVVRGALVGELLHIARLAVAPAARRRGHARLALAALAGWAAERGATRCALQVLGGNAPAVRLYTALGCTEHHRYQYWRPTA